jgi:hypothetical protein
VTPLAIQHSLATAFIIGKVSSSKSIRAWIAGSPSMNACRQTANLRLAKNALARPR